MPDARRECYNRLIEYMYSELEKFYTANPDLYKDERSVKAIAASRDGLMGILGILDEYDIQRKVE